MIKVFYDGECGLCSKEIRYYKRIAPPGIFDWSDITKDTTALEQENIHLSDALEQLHVKNAGGTIHTGVDSFIVIWQQLRGWKILAVFVKLPVIKPLLNFSYQRFAKWRFKRLAHCQLAAENNHASKS